MIEQLLARLWWQKRLPLWGWPMAGLSLLYAWLWRRRQMAYARGRRPIYRAAVPVLVVGNWIVGGAGKTPTTLACAAALRQRGFRPGIVCRGYGARLTHARPVTAHDDAAQHGDEAVLLARRAQGMDVPVYAGIDRPAAVEALLRAHPGVDGVICDDGLQHLGLHRDAQVVVMDERGLGNGWMLPAGPLRQVPWNPLPENTWVLYNASAASTHWPGVCAERRLSGVLGLAQWAAGEAPQPESLAMLARHSRAHPVDAVAGIASPQRFFDMLGEAGIQHRAHPRGDHARASDMAWPGGEGMLLVTEKDAVKIGLTDPVAPRVQVVTLDLHLPEVWMDTLAATLRRAAAPASVHRPSV